MILNTYRINACGDIRKVLCQLNRPLHYDIVALTMESAWAKFVHQRFDTPFLPNPADYDIRLLRQDDSNQLLKAMGVRS